MSSAAADYDIVNRGDVRQRAVGTVVVVRIGAMPQLGHYGGVRGGRGRVVRPAGEDRRRSSVGRSRLARRSRMEIIAGKHLELDSPPERATSNDSSNNYYILRTCSIYLRSTIRD